MLSILFPRTCPLCGRVLRGDSGRLCAVCLSELPYARQLGVVMNPTEQRFAAIREVERAAGWIFYKPQTPTARLLKQIKYRGGRGLARFLGMMLAREAKQVGMLEGVEGVVPVPVHPLRRMMRGYNQSRELARGICGAGELPLLDVVSAGRHTSQTRLAHSARRENVRGVFRLRSTKGLRPGMCLLLVDDVCTTGSTLSALAETLVAAVPGLRLRVLTLATVDRFI
ncbi:MAG: ComF family protein [Bacteroidales bacterium]|nr:ComF family protein [Bacteroidales bacterium]